MGPGMGGFPGELISAKTRFELWCIIASPQKVIKKF